MTRDVLDFTQSTSDEQLLEHVAREARREGGAIELADMTLLRTAAGVVVRFDYGRPVTLRVKTIAWTCRVHVESTLGPQPLKG